MATSEQQTSIGAGRHPGRQVPSAFALVENELGERVTLIQVVGELDAAVVDRLTGAIEAVPAAQATVVVGLDECEFIDSSGIAAILRAHRTLEAQSRRFYLCAPLGRVRRILEITGVATSELVIESLEDLPAQGGTSLAA